MSAQAMEALLDRWMSEREFRERLRQDPEETVRSTGLVLDADEWAALRAVDFSLSDEELQARVSKGGPGS
jgi:hypothetical protein